MTARRWTPATRAAIGNGYLREQFVCSKCDEVWDEDELDSEPPTCPDCGELCVALPIGGEL